MATNILLDRLEIIGISQGSMEPKVRSRLYEEV